MSEEILKALMQLFAIISKQDEGTTQHQRDYVNSFLSSQLNHEKVLEYLKLYDDQSSIKARSEKEQEKKKKESLTSMKDSVRTLVLCRKINKTLTQRQKVIVLIRLFELLKSDQLYTPQRIGIINTVSTVFNITNEELELISSYSRNDDPYAMDSGEILVVRTPGEVADASSNTIKHIYTDGLDGLISILRVKSVDLYFIRYRGNNEISMNGLPFKVNNINLYAPGSTLRLPQGTLYYSDVVSNFLSDENNTKISFKARNINYRFSNNTVGLHDINISEEFGLIGIMGASGSGKTTLLNVMAGIENPYSGSVSINGIDVHKEPEQTKGIIGYIGQDDFLMEDLTVFENLYYNAKLCFKNLDEDEILDLVDKTLLTLGLSDRKDVKVGNPMKKKISGGQRKRLNIALELIRKPSILFVDEPTSGLSSRDSENVMDLLKELSVNGKLIFVVIHQPSSDIFKMFDKLVILDNGGYPVYYGNPIEATMYFKKATYQINADAGECSQCGNVNPEQLFNILESKEVDDYGQYTEQRIRTALEWNELYRESQREDPHKDEKSKMPETFQFPDMFGQLKVFIARDVLSKISNLQYLMINLFEAPVLAFILVFIIRYATGSDGSYIFRENSNVSPYIFMSLIVALFIGLSVSAEEIFRDRKILKRESFLNLSKSGYLLSKIIILFGLSALQTLLFVIVGNTILGIKGLYMEYWLVLFSVACFANVLGLNISASFNSAVTIYILIPLLVIPQMILGGAMFSFDKLNQDVGGNPNRSPVIADVMVSRWAYEALSVTQFTKNKYGEIFYDMDKLESLANYKQVYFIPELQTIINESEGILENIDDESIEVLDKNLGILRNEISSESVKFNDLSIDFLDHLTIQDFNTDVAGKAIKYLDELNDKYISLLNLVINKKDNLIYKMKDELGGGENFYSLHDEYHNEFLDDLLTKATSRNKIIREKDRLVQIIDPVYLYPPDESFMTFRAHFYAPVKNLFGYRIQTLWFNLLIIWFFTGLLYMTLYFDVLKKMLTLSVKNILRSGKTLENTV